MYKSLVVAVQKLSYDINIGVSQAFRMWRSGDGVRRILLSETRHLKDSKKSFKDKDIFISAVESDINRVPA